MQVVRSSNTLIGEQKKEMKEHLLFDVYKVAFFGHRRVEDILAIEHQLLQILQELFDDHTFIDFYVGRNGEFDEIAASLVRLVQKANKDRNCAMTSLNLVLPYPTKDLEYYEEYYDDIIIYEAEKPPHFKRVITERNRFMVDMVDMVIAYVDKQEGGAYQAMRYAQLKSRELVVLRGTVNHHWE